MNGVSDLDSDDPGFVEVDPTGRYGRYNEILGKGASKTVHYANMSPEDLERLYCEIHLLKTLKHNNIMKFCTSWVDTANRNINFVTEMFTSGTLRQYRLNHKRVNIRAIKYWCRQILQGLLYLHSHDPPVIHRDLKCDNIFINGNQGEVKIGDLGLAAILRKSHADRCVGTPEFMAPEVYEEEYNELVDIYSFGMCILEMVTFEYPYSECTRPAQIYKKVISGKKPDALYKVKDPEVRRFVEKCLATVSNRLSAWELLNDPFLQIDDYVYDLRPSNYQQGYDEISPILSQHLLGAHQNTASSLVNGYKNFLSYEQENDLDCHLVEYEANEIDLFTTHEDEHLQNIEITIKGRRREDDNIFLRLRIADKEGRVRNIYFPFDIEIDTALSVANEMVSELDITDQDVIKIAEMIDGKIASLVPEWKTETSVDERLNHNAASSCQHCGSNRSVAGYSSTHALGKNLQVLECSKHGCGAIHGRFEEITYQFEGLEQCVTDGAPTGSSQSDGVHFTDIWDGVHFTDIWAQHEAPDGSSRNDADNHLVNEHENFEQLAIDKVERRVGTNNKDASNVQGSSSTNSSLLVEDYENDIRQELRWLKAKYQLQLRELKDRQIGATTKYPNLDSDNKGCKKDPETENDEFGLESNNSSKNGVYDYESAYNSCSQVNKGTGRNLYSGELLPRSLHRATSLPVDSTEF